MYKRIFRIQNLKHSINFSSHTKYIGFIVWLLIAKSVFSATLYDFSILLIFIVLCAAYAVYRKYTEVFQKNEIHPPLLRVTTGSVFHIILPNETGN